jgi:hypothetical protein
MAEVRHRRWLILSYFSAIDGMACAQHIDDRLPYLAKRGVIPVMLTGICGGRCPERINVRVPSVAPSGLRFELRHLKRKNRYMKLLAPLLTLILLPCYLLEKLLIDLDSQWSWFPLAIFRGFFLCGEYRPELIYSTGGPASAHVAAAIISSWRDIPWIAEFQDPLVCDDWLRSGRALKVFTWLERFVCTRAKVVIFLTQGAKERADIRTGLGVRGKVIYPGAEPVGKSTQHYSRGEYCRFAHFGSLGGSRNLKVFLEGLSLLLEERPELADLIRMDIFGTCDQLSHRLMKRFSHPQIITDFGRVPRKESIAAMERSDILLLIQNTEEFSTETIPSKVYEYLHTGRPILGLVYRNAELTELLIGLGHLAVDAASALEVKNGIARMVEQWRSGGYVPRPSPYTVEAAVDSLICVAAHLTGVTFPDTSHG